MQAWHGKAGQERLGAGAPGEWKRRVKCGARVRQLAKMVWKSQERGASLTLVLNYEIRARNPLRLGRTDRKETHPFGQISYEI